MLLLAHRENTYLGMNLDFTGVKGLENSIIESFAKVNC